MVQYFLMAAFCWMLVEGIYLYLFVVKVYNVSDKLKICHGVSWSKFKITWFMSGKAIRKRLWQSRANGLANIQNVLYGRIHKQWSFRHFLLSVSFSTEFYPKLRFVICARQEVVIKVFICRALIFEHRVSPSQIGAGISLPFTYVFAKIHSFPSTET